MFVLAYTGPGGGDEPDNTSEGLPASDDNGYRMFDVLTDLRGSWFWGHSVAAMRAVTCLETHPDVDPDRLGITGFSAGGVMSTIVAGRDPRVKAAVPLSGTLAWGAAVPSPNAWQHMLLTQAGLTVSSPEWGELLNLVDPTATLSMTNTSIFMVNGTSDEFFPLTAHLATYEAIPAGNKRTSFAANFDHGCYQLTGGESAQTIEDRAEIRGAGGQRMWFRHFFGTDPNYSYVPEPPVMEMAPLGLATAVTAVVDPGGSKLDVEHVKVWWSNDDAFLFGSVELSEQGGGIYGEMALFPTVAKTVAFVDVQYKVKGWLNNERFSISSAPILPEGFVPHIRHWETCL